jgi:hypothetical protein
MTEKLRYEISAAHREGATGDPEDMIRKVCAERGVEVSEIVHIPTADCYLFVANGEPSEAWPSYIVRPHVHGLRAAPED